MDVMLDTTFWGDVGLTVAARLALVALALWCLKITWGPRAPRRSLTITRPAETVPANRVSPIRPRTETVSRTTEHKAAVGERPSRDRMRQELLAYLEQRSAGRVTR